MSRPVVQVGIDEAGYGPILGPLVVTAVAFEVPPAQADADLWSVLSRRVSSTASDRKGRLPILDSKKLHKPKQGLARLERSVLAAVTAWRGLPPTLSRLVALLGSEAVGQLRTYDWYAHDDPPLPFDIDEGAVRIAARLLADELAGQSVRLRGVWSEILPEGHFNRLVNSTHNKSVVLSGLTLRLMQRAGEDVGAGGVLRFMIDKQGGRERYGDLLMRSFEPKRLTVLEESRGASTYALVRADAEWHVEFCGGGEARHLPIALASMISKYLREALMRTFNAYWASQVPGLRPTAGYYEDGRRFLRDIGPHLAQLRVDRSRLVRLR